MAATHTTNEGRKARAAMAPPRVGDGAMNEGRPAAPEPRQTPADVVAAAALLSAGGVDAGRGRSEGAAGMGVTTTATMKPRRRWVMKPQTLLMRV
jgi:hypothetical protein